MKTIYIILLALGVSISLNSQAAFTIDLVTSSPQINIGDNVLVQVQVSGLNQSSAPALGDSLGDYDVNINYDAGLFAFNNVSWGDSVKGNQLDINGFGGLFGNDSPSAGLLHFFQTSFDSAVDLESMQSDSFTLFSMVFSSLATGNASFSLTTNALGDAYGNNLAPAAVNGTTTVSVTPVPLPAAFPLLLSALCMLGVWGRRKV